MFDVKALGTAACAIRRFCPITLKHCSGLVPKQARPKQMTTAFQATSTAGIKHPFPDYYNSINQPFLSKVNCYTDAISNNQTIQ